MMSQLTPMSTLQLHPTIVKHVFCASVLFASALFH